MAQKLEILTTEEFFEKHKELTGHRLLMKNIANIKHCSASMFGNCVVGTLLIPDKRKINEHILKCGFYLDENSLLIIDDEKQAQSIFHQMAKEESFEGINPALILFELIDFLIRDDMLFLEEYDKKLSSVEDMVIGNMSVLPKDFDQFLSQHRKNLRILTGYYKLLAAVTDVMEGSLTKEERSRDRQLFAFLGNKVERLYQDAVGMAEYALQIRDIYQSKINSDQNKVMQLLTIVTTIFMPLTLITGWYGMNFKIMPELSFRYGYLCAAILAVIVVIIEIFIFKKKKWF